MTTSCYKMGIPLLFVVFPLLFFTYDCSAQNPARQFYRDTLMPALKAQHVRNFTVKGYDVWITDTGSIGAFIMTRSLSE